MKTSTRIIIIIIASLFLISLAPAGTYSGGYGYEETPYQIANPADWQELMATPTDWSGKHFILIEDIDLSGIIVTPIGGNIEIDDYENLTYFSGTFDGQGHTISNVTINLPNRSHIGLFGCLDRFDGEIHNLNLQNINITGYSHVGGLTGRFCTLISNCHSAGTVTCLYSVAGGLIGSCLGTGTIINCSSSANVIIDSTYEYSSSVGGLIGYHYGEIFNSYATGNVNGKIYVGGLVGYLSNLMVITDIQMNNCYATGNVNGSQFTGGLIGYCQGPKVSQCFAGGNVICPEYTGGLIGGISYRCKISNCYAYSRVEGNLNVGGFAGKSHDEDSVIENNYSRGLVIGNDPTVGGFLGSLDSGQVSNCFWDTQTSGKTTSAGGSGVSGKTTTQMQTMSTFTNQGWDFYSEPDNGSEEFWKMDGYPVFFNYSGGKGMINDPYQLATPEDILTLSRLTKHYDDSFIMTDDIDLGTYNFTNPVIGFEYPYEEFNGKFNGNGHIISNLNITSNTTHTGFFAILDSDAVVTNLGFINANISGFNQVGILCGRNEYSHIQGCFTTGTVSGISATGGLCGVNSGNIRQSYARCNVITEYTFAGGLCGSSGYGKIDQCYAACTLTGEQNLGGLISYLSSDPEGITACFWDTDVSYNASGGVASGVSPEGLFGKTTAQMQTMSTFTDQGWDFTQTWSICPGTNYPRLQVFIRPGEFLCPDGVDLADFSFFSDYYLNTNCQTQNNCQNTDLDNSGTTDLADFIIFCNNWLKNID